MDMLNRFSRRAALCGGLLLLSFSLAAGADEIQDINKLFKQGQQDQALGRVNTYLAAKPKDAQARFLKGLILTEQGKTADAIRIFSELTEDYPELPEPYNNLAVLYAGQGQYDKAKTALEMAIRTHPSYATAHENLGDIYAKMASQAYDRALQLDRSNTSTQTKLAMIKELFTGTAKSSKSSKTAVSAAKQQAAAAPVAPPVVNTIVPTIAPAEAAAPAEPTAPVEPVAANPVAPPEVVASAEPAATPEPAAPAEAAVEPAATEPAAPVITKKPTAHDSREVLNVVYEWAAAWSSKNVKRYLALYAADFKTPGGENRESWEAQRRDRISKPKSISVNINGPKVSFIDNSHASVTFKQSYRASHLKTSTHKTLVLVKSGDTWLIQEERAGK